MHFPAVVALRAHKNTELLTGLSFHKREILSCLQVSFFHKREHEHGHCAGVLDRLGRCPVYNCLVHQVRRGQVLLWCSSDVVISKQGKYTAPMKHPPAFMQWAIAQFALVVQPRLPCLQRLQWRALQSGAERLRALLESTQQPLRRGPCIRHGDLAVAGLADAQSCHHHIMKAGAVQASNQGYCKFCFLHVYNPLHHGAARHTEIVC